MATRYTWDATTKVNQIIPVGTTNPEKNLFYILVSSMLAMPGAACVSSCDSTTTSAGNLITGPSAVVYNAAGAHSWIVISFANGGEAMISANNEYSIPGIGVMWSPTGVFTGGNTTTDPSAADQIDATAYTSGFTMSGIALPYVFHGVWSTDGFRFHGILLADGGHTRGVISMNYIDDPVDANVSNSPRGVMFLGDGWDIASGSFAYVGRINSTDIAILPISSGLALTQHNTFANNTLASQFGPSTLDSNEPMFTVDAFADGTIVGAGTTHIVGRLGTLADMYYVDQLTASDNAGGAAQAPKINLNGSDRYAPFGAADTGSAIAIPWSASDVKVFGDGSDPSPTPTIAAKIRDPLRLPGPSPLSQYTWDTTHINQLITASPSPWQNTFFKLVQSLSAVTGASLTNSNSVGSAAAIGGTSWATISFANGGGILLCNPGTTSFNCAWSPTNAWTGGSGATLPTATDALYCSNYNSWTLSAASTGVLHVTWSTDGMRVRATLVSGGGAGSPGFTNGGLDIDIIDDPVGSVATSPRGICKCSNGWAEGGLTSDNPVWLGHINGHNIEIMGISRGNAMLDLHNRFPAANVGDPTHFGSGTRTVVGKSPLHTLFAFANGIEVGDTGFGAKVENVTNAVHGVLGRFADLYSADGYQSPEAAGSDSSRFPRIIKLDNNERWAVFSGNNDYSATAIKWDSSNLLTVADGSDPTPTATVAGVIADPLAAPAPPAGDDVIITGAPIVSTQSTSATFTFTVNTGPAEYSLDGSPFSAHASPINLVGLALGLHTITIRSQSDHAAFETFNWTIAPASPTPSPPLITIVTPLPPPTLNTPIVFTVVSTDGFPLVRAWASVHFAGIIGDEVIHTGDRFGAFYTNPTNTRTTIANGFQYTVLRDGGWPVSPLASSFDISAAAATFSGGGTTVADQVYTYTILGTEPGFGTDDVTIPLEATMPNTAYQALATDGGRIDSAQVFFTCPVAGYTTTHFVAHGTSAPAIGDKINVRISANA